MSAAQPQRFGELLRRYRARARLTQEQLAERAGLSARGISDLERGVNRTPQPVTLALLAEALGLTAEERAEFEAAARRYIPPDEQPPTVPLASPPPSALAGNATLEHYAQPEAVARVGPRRAGLLSPFPTRSRLVVGLLVIAVLGGTLFSAGAAVQRLLPGGGALCIATSLPVSGQDGAQGRTIENAVNLAVQQNADLGSAYRLRAINYDDESASGTEGSDAERGASNMAAMVKNPCVVGMVGPYYSYVAPGEMRIAANAGLVMISPTNTNPGLTMRPYAGDVALPFDQMHPAGKKTNYFRDIPSDVVQGVADANVVFHDLVAHSVYVVADRYSYAAWLVGGFTRQYLLDGGAIVGTMSIPYDNATDIAEVAKTITASKPDAVYFGGTVGSGGALLDHDLAQDGYTGDFVGGDALAGDPAFLAQTGRATRNTFASHQGPDPSAFTSGAGAAFVRAYHARYPGQPLDSYSAYAYDAAMALITAMRNLIRADQLVTRPAMIDQIQNITYSGVTGTLSFDQNGDVSQGLYTIYQAQNGAWTVFDTVTI